LLEQTDRPPEHGEPPYGTSYLVGKTRIELLIADRAAALGGRFTLRSFMGRFPGARDHPCFARPLGR
jgi:hypothetical protein